MKLVNLMFFTAAPHGMFSNLSNSDYIMLDAIVCCIHFHRVFLTFKVLFWLHVDLHCVDKMWISNIYMLSYWSLMS